MIRFMASRWRRCVRPDTLIASALLLCTLGIVVFVHAELTSVEEGLPLEVLTQQQEGAVLARELTGLRAAVEAAGSAPSAGELEMLRGLVDRAKAKVESLQDGHDFDQLLGVSAMHAVVAPVLDDLERWLALGLHGQAPGSEPVMTLVALRVSDAHRQIRSLYAQSSETALDLLQAQARSVGQLRKDLIVVLVFIGTLALVLMFFVARGRRANSAAERARLQLREGIDSLSDGFALFDRKEQLVLCNQGYARAFPGLEQNPAPGTSFEGLLRRALARQRPEERPENQVRWSAEHLARFRSPGTATEVRTGDDRWYRICERRTGEGGVVALVRETTEHRLREAELRDIGAELGEKNRILDAALGNMTQGLAMFDHAFRLVVCNQRLSDLLELPQALTQPGAALAGIIRHGLRRGKELSAAEIELATRQRLVTARERDEFWYREIETSGRVVEVRFRSLPELGSLVTFEDVTRQYQAEQELHGAKNSAEIANRTKSEFLANISHELRTPLNAIIGFSDIIHREMFGPIGSVSYKSYAKDIHESGTQLLSMIDDILAFSSMETGSLELKEQHLDLAKAIRAMVRKLKRSAATAGLAVQVEVPETLPLLRADSRALEQIVLNLLANAIKFTPAGGSVTISADHQGARGLVLAVTDTGIGIAGEDLSTVMAPFSQLEGVECRKHGGTGLGLPLSRHLVELHGGELTIESTAGAGTGVKVRFPPDRVVVLRRRSQRVGS